MYLRSMNRALLSRLRQLVGPNQRAFQSTRPGPRWFSQFSNKPRSPFPQRPRDDIHEEDNEVDPYLFSMEVSCPGGQDEAMASDPHPMSVSSRPTQRTGSRSNTVQQPAMPGVSAQQGRSYNASSPMSSDSYDTMSTSNRRGNASLLSPEHESEVIDKAVTQAHALCQELQVRLRESIAFSEAAQARLRTECERATRVIPVLHRLAKLASEHETARAPSGTQSVLNTSESSSNASSGNMHQPFHQQSNQRLDRSRISYAGSTPASVNSAANTNFETDPDSGPIPQSTSSNDEPAFSHFEPRGDQTDVYVDKDLRRFMIVTNEGRSRDDEPDDDTEGGVVMRGELHQWKDRNRRNNGGGR